MHFIELEKFKKKNPDCSTNLAQWLWLIEGSEEKLAVAKKMKTKGLTTEEIMEYAELTKEEIEKL